MIKLGERVIGIINELDNFIFIKSFLLRKKTKSIFDTFRLFRYN